MLSSGCQSAALKRKRRPSDQNSVEDLDIENLPTNEEKKYKDDSRMEASCSFERDGERLPFSELKVVSDSNIDTLVHDQERLSLLEESDTSPSYGLGSCDVANLSDFSSSSPERVSSPLALTPGTSAGASPSYQSEDQEEKINPLPTEMTWSDISSLWQLMCDKDEDSLRTREPDVFSHHPNLQPRMRSVLLDWISEVCDVYKLHRETYYLTMDYIDRYLSTRIDIPKQQLQLIGITCLQLATKNEEIYPPKMAEYAYVTDGACTEREIIAMEIIIAKALGWRLNPMTPIYFLNMYLQIAYSSKVPQDLTFWFPRYNASLYSRVAHLLNLCTLDVNSLRFSYSVLTAAALYLAANPSLATAVSGLEEDDLASCVSWMSVFWDVLKTENPEYSKRCNKYFAGSSKFNPVTDDGHDMQKHNISLNLLDVAMAELARRAPSCLLTPPSSSKKNPNSLPLTMI